MEYEDFAVKFEPGEDGKHRVLVLSSPAGEGSGVFGIPFDQQALPVFLHNSASRHILLDTPEDPVDPAAIGGALFQALFSGRILDLYQRSLGSLEEHQGLRIRLHLDPELPGLDRVCRLPWELLHQRDRGFLGLSLSSPIVRYLNVPRPPTPVPLDGPLRVLVVIALPADVPYLNLGLERIQIETAWRGVSEADVRFLEGANRESLFQSLAEGRCHVLHFMGHGEMDAVSGEGALILEGHEGETDYLTGSRLAELLESDSLPALVVLNACRTAEGTQTADAFAGVAGSLVKAGILSVVAMQAPISDCAALAFSKKLFRRLAAGDPVDAAVTAGRLAIRAISESSSEWSIPVLFMRRPDGKIFDPARVALRERETALRLVRSLSGWQREQFLAELDPGGSIEPGAEEDVCEVAALRGGEDWLHCCEVLLTLRSPVYPFDGSSLREWSSRPRRNWQIHGESLAGVGEDFEAVSSLTWEGLRFRDGSVEARVEIPLLAVGGAAGLALRWTRRSAVLGLLRGDPDTGGGRAEILQRRGEGLAALRSVPIALQEEPCDIRLSVVDRRATLHVGGKAIACDLKADPVPGYAGLVKLGGALAYFRRPAVAVTNLLSGTTRRSS